MSVDRRRCPCGADTFHVIDIMPPDGLMDRATTRLRCSGCGRLGGASPA